MHGRDKKSPEAYKLKPFGLPPAGTGPVKKEYPWTPQTAFKTLPIWGTAGAFLTAMVAEFLIWTQVVRYWTVDAKMSLSTATNLYIFIGIAGIFTMPLLGKFADSLVVKFGNETKARKVMLIARPGTTEEKLFHIQDTFLSKRIACDVGSDTPF